jgi:hypothetical protein
MNKEAKVNTSSVAVAETLANGIRSVAEMAKYEEELRIGVEKLLEPALQKLGIAAHPLFVITFGRQRRPQPDTRLGRAIINAGNEYEFFQPIRPWATQLRSNSWSGGKKTKERTCCVTNVLDEYIPLTEAFRGATICPLQSDIVLSEKWPTAILSSSGAQALRVPINNRKGDTRCGSMILL